MTAPPPASPLTEARILKYHSNFYYAESDGVVYECFLRGLLKKEGADILVGDRVTLDSVDFGNRTGRIHQVMDRKNVLSRPKIANVDQVIVVHPFQEPMFSPSQLDRYLTHSELAGITPIVCISKCDLAPSEADLSPIFQLYEEALGYRVIATSVHHPETLETFLAESRNKVSVLAGLSGAGKSSLLNALCPSLTLKVQEVSEKLSRGQHTTRHTELLEVETNTFIADTPGFSNLKFNTVPPEAIEQVFRDFAILREACEFSNCLHEEEPGCNVQVRLKDIAPSRFESYRDLLAEARLYAQEAQARSQKSEYGYKTLQRKGKEDVRILRLKEKVREGSRRTQKQEISTFFDDESTDQL